MVNYKSRNEVPDKYKWDLTDFFKDETEFQEKFEEDKTEISELKNYVGCTKEADKMYEFLEKYTYAAALYQNLYVYAYLINDQELGVSESIERKSKTEKLSAELETNTSFFSPELLKLSQDEYNNLFKQNEKLYEYKSDLDRTYREKEHILTENEEKIMSELLNSMNHYDDISSNLLNNENTYGKIKLEDGIVEEIATTNYRKLMRNKDVKIRKKVYNSFNKTLDQHSTTNSMLLNSFVSMYNSYAKIRKYKSPWDAKLFSMNLNNNIYKTLVKTTEDNVDVLQKYYRLKKDVLGLEVLNAYDLSLELSKNNKEYTIEEAQELTKKALIPLGNEYLERFNKVFDRRYIDYCQYKGKCSGGYSFSTALNDSRILLSFNGNLDSVSTIIHEGGHNVHHQFIKENNPVQYRESSSIVAEVASLTNECLLSSYLAEHGTTKEEKLSGIENILGVITSNLFGAVREGKMEQDMYKTVQKGGTLTKDYLDKLTMKSLRKYYGNAIKKNKNMKNSWVLRSHYYMNFDLYSYAICISVASNVASKVLKGDKEMLNNYLAFLKCGNDKWPIETFEVLGVNLEDKTVYENAIKYFDELIDKYYEIMNEEVK